MTKILALMIIGICYIIFLRTNRYSDLNQSKSKSKSQSRRKGHFPHKEKATLFDVRDLLIKGERELAIQLYVQIFKTRRKEASKAIEELEKNLRNS